MRLTSVTLMAVAAAVASPVLVASAEEGRPLTTATPTVTAGQSVTVSGDGCAGGEVKVRSVRLDEGVVPSMDPTPGEPLQELRLLYPTDGSAWSATFLTSGQDAGRTKDDPFRGPLQIHATCTTPEGTWDYAMLTVDVVAGEAPAAPGGVAVSSTVISPERGISAYGVGCVDAAGKPGTVQVWFNGEPGDIHKNTMGDWESGYRVPIDATGTITVTASCVGLFDYAPAEVAVLPGNYGGVVIPITGETDSPTPSPTPSPSGDPGLPSTGW